MSKHINKRERANEHGKFTGAEIRAAVKASQAYWASPEGRKAKREQINRALDRKPAKIKFPELAKRAGTKPEIDSLDIRRAITFGR